MTRRKGSNPSSQHWHPLPTYTRPLLTLRSALQRAKVRDRGDDASEASTSKYQN